MRLLLTGWMILLVGCPDPKPEDVEEEPTDSADTALMDVDGDGFSPEDGDCDDTAASVHPGAAEVCDGVDNDCDGAADGEDASGQTDWYADSDGDGYGDPSAVVTACAAPAGHVADATDCDDADPAYNPGADESDCADPNDYNCDGATGYADNDGDGYAACAECDDGDAAINPGAAEVCDGVDNDCDGAADGEDEVPWQDWYADSDGDGYGAGAAVRACAAPAGHVADATDCDDADPAYNPGADESDCADPNDYNCDGTTGYADNDGDGFAACQECDDSAAAVNPAAAEVCDGVDNNCDGAADGADASGQVDWYADGDGDSYGAGAAVRACAAPAGHVADATDCDDGDASFHPGADESDCADPSDYNCDGTVAYADGDGDGYAACVECDDGDAAINPGAVEVCDGVDNNCDGTADGIYEIPWQGWYLDSDSDGYGDPAITTTACAQPAGYVADATDCDDASGAFHPGADESDCADPNDYNCDGAVVYADGDGDGYAACVECDDGDAAVNPAASEICDGVDNNCDGTADGTYEVAWQVWYADSDRDGYGDPAATTSACSQPAGYVADATDCDDGSAAINPGAQEICDGADTDEDCDGSADNNDSSAAVAGKTTYYLDSDGDGYGSTTSGQYCDQPSGYVTNSSDCNDGSAAINPGAQEICDGADTDEDCDGSADNNDSSVAAAGKSTYYRDSDSDGYGSTTSGQYCDQPSGYVSTATDCDDGSAAINPGAQEICDGADTDEDCDGSADNNDSSAAVAGKTTYYLDSDGDGYGSTTSGLYCDQPSGYATNSSDCDDGSASAYPGHPSPGSQTFNYTGAQQTFTVPACATQVTITAYGAQGTAAYSNYGYLPGYGGMAQGVLSASSGATLYVYVGGSNGYNGGGSGWSGSVRTCNGGGASDVRVGGSAISDRVIVAGGGGGVSGETNWGNGGDGGGGTCGANYCGGEGGGGYYNTPGGNGGSAGGSGITSCHGGAGGGAGVASGGGGATTTCYGTYSAGTGTLGSGGVGASSPTGCCRDYGAAGGGGGYYGGGGVAGGCCGGGGAGGGSSWTGTLTSPAFAAGVRTGNGQVIISW